MLAKRGHGAEAANLLHVAPERFTRSTACCGKNGCRTSVPWDLRVLRTTTSKVVQYQHRMDWRSEH